MSVDSYKGPVGSRTQIVKRLHLSVKYTRLLSGPGEVECESDALPTRTTELDAVELQEVESRLGIGTFYWRERLQAGDTCYGTRDHHGTVAAFCWVSSGRSLYLPEVGAEIWVPAEAAYWYNGFTFPGFRGRGALSTLARDMLVLVKRSHFEVVRYEGWTLRSNTAVRKAFENAGFERSGYFLFASLGPVHLSVGRPWLRDGWL